MSPRLILFLAVFLLNVIPAFASPTWMVFSFLGFRFPSHIDWSFALIGAIAAATGRSVLGKMSRTIVRKHWLSEAARDDVDSLKLKLEKRPTLTFGLFLFYAFTPLPSNFLFIAYGLTTMPLIRLTAPFLIGRFVSYSFWTMSSTAVSRKLELEDTDAMAYFSIYFVLTQLALLALAMPLLGSTGTSCCGKENGDGCRSRPRMSDIVPDKTRIRKCDGRRSES